MEIVKNETEFVFITHESSTDSVIPLSYKKRFVPKSIKIVDEPLWLAHNFLPEEHVIIADGYHFTGQYQKQLKELGFNLLYIDDLASEHMYADVVINHSPYIKQEHYSKEPGTVLALGTKYALLRPLFLIEAQKERVINSINTVFLCFGGADPLNLTITAVKALLGFTNFKKINIILGAAYENQEILELEKSNKERMYIYRNLSEERLIEIMKQSNFGVVSASTILYELCCIKMPILCGFYVDNQELIYKGFLKNTAIYNGGDMKEYKISNFTTKIRSILDTETFESQIKAQKDMFDDKIGIRHVNIIKNLCKL